MLEFIMMYVGMKFIFFVIGLAIMILSMFGLVLLTNDLSQFINKR